MLLKCKGVSYINVIHLLKVGNDSEGNRPKVSAPEVWSYFYSLSGEGEKGEAKGR